MLKRFSQTKLRSVDLVHSSKFLSLQPFEAPRWSLNHTNAILFEKYVIFTSEPTLQVINVFTVYSTYTGIWTYRLECTRHHRSFSCNNVCNNASSPRLRCRRVHESQARINGQDRCTCIGILCIKKSLLPLKVQFSIAEFLVLVSTFPWVRFG